jgi:hypothetical protein
MQITFNIPHGFSTDSTPGENARANGILREIVSRLNVNDGSGASSVSRTGRCLFTFDLPFLFCAGSTPVQDGAALQALLDGLIAFNIEYRQRRRNLPDLHVSGVRYGRTDIWDTTPALRYGRKPPEANGIPYGDCKSLSADLVAQYRCKGIEAKPVFRWVRTSQNTKDYHILVLTPNGFEDPSKDLGMGTDEVTHGNISY